MAIENEFDCQKIGDQNKFNHHKISNWILKILVIELSN
jgi:hypothetical protein